MPRRSTTHHPESSNSVRRRAYLLIQKKIASGELKAGTLISEVALAKELGSSRTPVREAAGQLLAEGLLDLSPGGGIIVTQLTRQAIRDLYELREALEVFAVGRVAQSGIRSADKDRLNHLLGETQTLLKELKSSGAAELDAEQMKRFALSDLSFHTLLIRLAANARILKVVNETRLMIRIFGIQRSGHKREELERIYRHHKAILEAVIRQEVEDSRKLLAEHIQASAKERLDEFDLWERENQLAGLDVIDPLQM
ncbi:GntR family transcriptional regulator [Edaphobacter sp. 12200R-103]|jgi:DNA-binding GntR family transcriptional regulator|uniref:GntR family transcriptional regulator n=1 Tax=Edaphobacter sp. 12200R-103 TaxID=2703788 RepID=UPI00138D8F93|nr:GntR family transcriptional regulator [Edaphobacter sp. 12200R-103]QHS51066.1 GntR family transcriptional regulator [Edaphobacter sp. 12200R-103]